jgi:ketosteroid isomerase-like protein
MASSTTMVRPGEIVQAAISRGDLARVRDLLRNGASATERGRHDTTALHWAAAANEAAIVRELLDHGADPNARAADGCSALHYAAREDAAEAVNALLAGGADARATNREGRTPLQEVYDEEDEDGAATARALRDGEKSKALFSFDANATETKDSRSVGACTKDSDAAETKKRATSFGPTNSAADDALERAMEDMARLLRAEKGASPAGPIAETTASKKTTRSSSGSGATDSGAARTEARSRRSRLGNTFPRRRTRFRAVTLKRKLPCGCGSGRTGDCLWRSTRSSKPRTSRRRPAFRETKKSRAFRTSACPRWRSPRRTRGEARCVWVTRRDEPTRLFELNDACGIF